MLVRMDRWVSEVVELHRFFESWLSGSVVQSSQQFDRLAQALAPGFAMIDPGGNLVSRGRLVDMLWAAHASIAAPLRIEVCDTVSRELMTSLALLVYEEWQFGVTQNARISSALLSRVDDGIQWLHLQETWMKSDV